MGFILKNTEIMNSSILYLTRIKDGDIFKRGKKNKNPTF